MSIDLNTVLDISIIFNSILIGVILVTQIVSYPLFLEISDYKFPEYHNAYSKRIAIVVIPIMTIELIATIYMALIEQSSTNILLSSLILLIWGSTFLIQVPIHRKLSQLFNKNNVKQLINSNWIRTILWSAKLTILILAKN